MVPLTRIASQSDLSPQAGRGKANVRADSMQSHQALTGGKHHGVGRVPGRDERLAYRDAGAIFGRGAELVHFQGTNRGINEDTDLFAGEHNVGDDAGLRVPARRGPGQRDNDALRPHHYLHAIPQRNIVGSCFMGEKRPGW
jgi:hypothetical protein